MCVWGCGGRGRGSCILEDVDPSAAAVFELSVLGDGQLGGVGGREAVAEVLDAVALLHLGQCRHEPRVRRVQRANPLFLGERARARERRGE